jgi:hypothetical protein
VREVAALEIRTSTTTSGRRPEYDSIVVDGPWAVLLVWYKSRSDESTLLTERV